MLKQIKFHFGLILIFISICLSTLTLHATTTVPSIDSETAVLIDGSTGQILYEKDANKLMYPASITKLMTALLAIESLDPEDTLIISKEAIESVDYSSSRIGLYPEEELTVNDALHGLLLMSANEAANALAEKTSKSIDAFVDSMNTRAQEIGALNTHFTNPHGLFEETHQTTAYDMAIITQELIKHPYFLDIMQDSTYEIPVTNKSNETRLLYQQHKMLNSKNDLTVYRDDVIAGKVGYTSQSKNTLVTVAREGNRTLIAVVMRAEGPSLYPDTAKLLDYGFNEFKQINLPSSSFTHKQAIHDNGIEIGRMDLTLANDLQLCIPTDSEPEYLVYSLELPSQPKTNLSTHDLFGTAILSIGSLELTSLPLQIDSLVYDAQSTLDNNKSEINASNSTVDASIANENADKNPWKILLSVIFIGTIGIMGFIIKII